MKVLVGAIMLPLTMFYSALSFGSQETYLEEQMFQLLPSPCVENNSNLYATQHCAAQRHYVLAKLKDCEIKRDGLLVKDEARNILVCVKAKKVFEGMNYEF
ncbi:hypothetical protein ACV4QK_20910 (plasmid) [Alteromonas macleodii]